MDAKIDYASFTIMVDLRAGEGGHVDPGAVGEVLWRYNPVLAAWCDHLGEWNIGGARGHYGMSLFNQETFMTVRFGGSANHILVELPGTACQAARDVKILDRVIETAAGRLTRLDIAVDIPGGCSPGEFVAAGYNDRFKAHASLVSEEGTTEYVGSMKSDRFARVYMYAKPHPRAGILRVEHVLRGDYAKAAAAALPSGTAVMLAEMCGNSFAWLSAAWQPDRTTDGKLRARRIDRHQPGRVRWLYQVCIPALEKAVNEGLIDRDVLIARMSGF